MSNPFLKSIALLIFISSASAIHAEVYYKEIRKTVKVNSSARLDMNIDYADVNIVTGDQNQIEIIVKQNVDSKSQERANEIFENIKVDISESMDLVGLVVSLGSYSCRGNSESYSINVEIKMPASGTTSGEISFGNFTISELKGPCEMKVQYGNISAQNLSSRENDIEVAFGNAIIYATSGGDFENQYGDLEIKKLNGNAEISSSFGDLKIKQVTNEVRSLELDLSYGDAEIDLASDYSCSFDMHTSYGDIDLPASAKTSKSESDYTSKHLIGTIGSGSANKLEIKNDFGDVDIDVN